MLLILSLYKKKMCKQQKISLLYDKCVLRTNCDVLYIEFSQFYSLWYSIIMLVVAYFFLIKRAVRLSSSTTVTLVNRVLTTDMK